jgi:hypothetical protein
MQEYGFKLKSRGTEPSELPAELPLLYYSQCTRSIREIQNYADMPRGIRIELLTL